MLKDGAERGGGRGRLGCPQCCLRGSSQGGGLQGKAAGWPGGGSAALERPLAAGRSCVAPQGSGQCNPVQALCSAVASSPRTMQRATKQPGWAMASSPPAEAPARPRSRKRAEHWASPQAAAAQSSLKPKAGLARWCPFSPGCRPGLGVQHRHGALLARPPELGPFSPPAPTGLCLSLLIQSNCLCSASPDVPTWVCPPHLVLPAPLSTSLLSCLLMEVPLFCTLLIN